MEIIMRKGQIACNKQFLLFSQYFLHYMDQSKILSDNGLNIRNSFKKTDGVILRGITFQWYKSMPSGPNKG